MIDFASVFNSVQEKTDECLNVKLGSNEMMK